MNLYKKIFILILTLTSVNAISLAQSKIIKGKIINDKNYGINNAFISIDNNTFHTESDSLGSFELSINTKSAFQIDINALGYQSITKKIQSDKDTILLNFVLKNENEMLDGVIVTDTRARNEVGMFNIDVSNVGIRPDPTGGIEGMLKILVGNRNELSSQYSVRGGNFDENLVYINDFEVYRPFLVRSGQQEGLSVINSDLVAKVDFSVGGFQAKFGDKISSALDITYKKPTKFAGSVMASLLGAQAHLEGSSKNNKFYYMIGLRNKTNQYLLQAQPTQGQYNPSFTDGQIVLGYRWNRKWETEFIGNYSMNKFTFYPKKSTEFFGYLNQAFKLNSSYEGGEIDQFDALFGGWSLQYKPNDKTQLKLLLSAYQTNEKETYDLNQSYLLDAVETDLGKNVGETVYSLGSGSIINHARNYLNASIFNIGHKGHHAVNKHFIQWGANFQYVTIHDALKEWEYRDSAGYSQPHDPILASMVRSYTFENDLTYQRISAYIQDNIDLSTDRNAMTLNLGVRSNYSSLNEELLISPRVQFSIKPSWKRNIVFRVASGLYHQPPFYREMRSYDGTLYTNLKAQKSFHVAAGFDYNFTAWGDRPFKLTGEVFYKSLWDITPHEYENVRIRYYPDRSAIGYSYGAELRLFGDIVKDAESWVSIGLLSTENKFLNADGSYTEYIPRPTDQRATFGLYFSDYLPNNKNFKAFVNGMYATGLPYNLPGKALQSNSQIRIPDYKRVDIGFAALLLDGKRNNRPAYSMFSYINDIWLSLEVFNLLGNLNTLSYQFIQPMDSEMYFLVPNRLTQRLINVKLAIRF